MYFPREGCFVESVGLRKFLSMIRFEGPMFRRISEGMKYLPKYM